MVLTGLRSCWEADRGSETYFTDADLNKQIYLESSGAVSIVSDHLVLGHIPRLLSEGMDSFGSFTHLISSSVIAESLKRLLMLMQYFSTTVYQPVP